MTQDYKLIKPGMTVHVPSLLRVELWKVYHKSVGKILTERYFSNEDTCIACNVIQDKYMKPFAFVYDEKSILPDQYILVCYACAEDIREIQEWISPILKHLYGTQAFDPNEILHFQCKLNPHVLEVIANQLYYYNVLCRDCGSFRYNLNVLLPFTLDDKIYARLQIKCNRCTELEAKSEKPHINGEGTLKRRKNSANAKLRKILQSL